MRMLAAAVLASLAAPALAQDRPTPQGFNRAEAADAARLNQAVQNDPQARQALDKVESHLKQHGHKAGTMLEKTRP